jgi:hypothetical protein
LPKSRPIIPQDFIVDILTPSDNNVSHRNYYNLPTSTDDSLNSFLVRNPYSTKIDVVLRLNNPREWQVSLDKFRFNEILTLQPNEDILVKVNAKLPNVKKSGEITITQERVDLTPAVVMGGITLGFKPDEQIGIGPSTSYKWWASIHGGLTLPITDFGSRYKSSYMFAVDWSYHFNPRLSVVALIGFNHFRAKPTFSYLGNTYWWNLSANLKWEFTTSPTRPYINGGMGAYIPKSGPTKLGYNLGIGIDRTLTPTLVFELGADYHHILTRLEDPEFYTIHAGLIFRL